LPPALHGSEDTVGGFGPDERFGLVVGFWHRPRTFKRSTDPALAEKVEDIVGLYMHPPTHAVVLSIDEKSQIQALDRTQPGLPIKPGTRGGGSPDRR
jgi:hypothetical protein